MNKLIHLERNLPVIAPDLVESVVKMQSEYKRLGEELSALKSQLMREFEDNEILKIENEYLVLSYVAPTMRETLDTKALRKEYPDVYDEFVGLTEVKGSVRIKIKEKANGLLQGD